MAAKALLLLLATISCCVCLSNGQKKILIYPVDCGFNSRLMNLVKMADMLNVNGYNATVLVNNRVAKLLEPRHTKLLIYDVPNVENIPLLSDQEVLDKMKDLKLFSIGQFIEDWIDLMLPFCDAVFGTEVIHNLKAEGYDLVIVDNIWDCGKVLIEYLDVPSIMYSNWGFTLDPFLFYPILPSFVCTAGTEVCSSGNMDFGQRVANFIQSVMISTYVVPLSHRIYREKLLHKHKLNLSDNLLEYRAIRSPVIVNGDWVLDYPRPLMPNVIMLPGLWHKVAKPLPADMQSFIEGSAPHGVVVVSFGSMVSSMDERKAEIFATVLGELPQRVIWRHTGPTPESLKGNTKLVSWFPQSDVLRHPLTKMFITHCGISGTYEAAMNALPVVAIPLFADQEYNSRKLTERGGMGIRLTFDDITEESLRNTVREVIHNTKYLVNAQRVARLLKDEAMPAVDRLLYWVNYTIRHDGAKHLISDTALNMSNFEFYSIDVIVFLCIVLFITLALVLLVLYCCVRFATASFINVSKQKVL